MLKLFVLTCLLAQAFADRRVLLRGDASKLDERIAGGTTADITEVPFQVALLLNILGVDNYIVACGGSIISETVILTAAHCFDDYLDVRYWRVRAGSTNKNSGGQVVSIARNVFPYQYGGLYNDYDIALSFLSTAIIIDNILTAPVKLPEQDYTVPDNTRALFTGWGAEQNWGSATTNLRKVTIPTVNQDSCNRSLAVSSIITERMMCAGESSLNGKGPCQGDGGGPLSIDGVVIGLASWSYPCVRPAYPAVFTKVSAFRNWIDSHL